MAIINQRWPTTLLPQSCKFGRTRNDVRQYSPRTRQDTVITMGRPLWTAECTWRVAQNTATAAALRRWLEALDGFRGSVQIWDFSAPQNTTGYPAQAINWVNGGVAYWWINGGILYPWNNSITRTANAAATAGATSVALAGFAASQVGAVIMGQYIQIGRRLYLSDTDVNANGSGVATVTLQTPLLANVANGDTIRLSAAACEMQLASQDWSGSATAGGGFVDVTATFIESVDDVT